MCNIESRNIRVTCRIENIIFTMFIFINVTKIDSFYRYLFYVLNDSKSINHPLILIQLSNFMKKQIDLKFIPIKNSKILVYT
jgi:hypothetical protein